LQASPSGWIGLSVREGGTKRIIERRAIGREKGRGRGSELIFAVVVPRAKLCLAYALKRERCKTRKILRPGGKNHHGGKGEVCTDRCSGAPISTDRRRGPHSRDAILTGTGRNFGDRRPVSLDRRNEKRRRLGDDPRERAQFSVARQGPLRTHP